MGDGCVPVTCADGLRTSLLRRHFQTNLGRRPDHGCAHDIAVQCGVDFERVEDALDQLVLLKALGAVSAEECYGPSLGS